MLDQERKEGSNGVSVSGTDFGCRPYGVVCRVKSTTKIRFRSSNHTSTEGPDLVTGKVGDGTRDRERGWG